MSDADNLRAYLAERDAPCPGCGYNLRGITSADCPECDEPLYLHHTIRSLRRRRIHWAWCVPPLVWHGFFIARGTLDLMLYLPESVMPGFVLAEASVLIVAGVAPAAMLVFILRQNWQRRKIPWVVLISFLLSAGLPILIVYVGFMLTALMLP